MIPKTRKGAISFNAKIRVNAPIDKVWKYISDTELLNRSMKEPPFEFREVPNPRGGSIRYGKQIKTGFTLEFIERPFQWVKNKYYILEREFIKGPLTWYCVSYEFEDNGDYFIVNFTSRIAPRFFLIYPLIWREMKFDYIPRLKRTYGDLEKFYKGELNRPMTLPSSLSESRVKERLNVLIPMFKTFSTNEKLNYNIGNYLLTAPEYELQRIRPYAIAKNLSLDKNQTLVFFLKATKNGLFDLHWDVLCPNCRGAKFQTSSLREMKKTAHCESCNIDYNADFDKSIEITFKPASIVREINDATFCIGGAGNTPHIISQIRIPAGKTEEVELDLEQGAYRIYSPHLTEKLDLQIAEGFENTVEISYGVSKINSLQTNPSTKKLLLSNPDLENEITVKIEKSKWFEDITTAYEVTLMQEFRDLFSREVLPEDLDMAVKNVTILFTDLKDSTDFYNSMGDSNAFHLVRKHFKILTEDIPLYRGAIVKTIGDAIMAVFPSPLNALMYACQVQGDLKVLNEKLGKELIILKIGVHSGPALAVNLNERIDYFGQTVNLTSRIEGQCNGSWDIVISKKIFESEGVAEFIEWQRIKVEIFSAKLKGFQSETELVRLTL